MTEFRSKSGEEPATAAQQWVVRLASREIDDKQLRQFEEWLAASDRHRAAFDTARRAWVQVGQVDSLLPQRAFVRPTPVKWAAAAAIAAVACFVVLDPVTRLRASDMTAVGEVRRVTLPDGSISILDTDSAIAVDYGVTERRVRLLQGAAWFDVKRSPERPFVVEAGDATAEAKGTAYGVALQADATRVEVTHGHVQVISSGGVYQLTAGQRIDASADPAMIASSSATPMAWRSGRIDIQSATLREAIAAIDRYRPGHILVLGPLSDVRLNVSIDIAEPDRGLDSLAESQSLKRVDISHWLTILIPWQTG